MIELNDVTIFPPGFKKRTPILRNANATFGRGERVGILALPGTGKSTIARMLSGIEKPNAGTITSEGFVSWPIGFAGFLHPYLSVKDNLTVFAGLVGLPQSEVFQFCVDFCGIPGLLSKNMSDLSPTQRAILAYCAVSNPTPAMWIADEVITIGEPNDRKKCDKILAERLEDGGLVFLSRNVRLLKLYCDRYFVLLNQRLVPCDDLDKARNLLEVQSIERGLAASEVV